MFQISHHTARRRKTKPLGPTKHPQTFTFQEPLRARTFPPLHLSPISAYFQTKPTTPLSIQITPLHPSIPAKSAKQTQQTHPKPSPPETLASLPHTRTPPVAHCPP